MLYLAEPLNACIPLTNDLAGLEVSRSPFALIIRGGCAFENKIRNAQHAGFKAAIIYDDEDTGDLIAKFHAVCVDSWLTIWRTFCPVCKRDVRASIGNPPASECTPLLSPAVSVPASPSSSAILSSSHSLRTGSPAIRITQASYHSPASSRSQSLASTPVVPYSLRSYGNSSAVQFSRSSADLQNLASQRSRPPHLPSPHSFGLPYLFSPSGSRHGSYLMGSTNASPFCVGSSSRPPCLLHHSESTTSISPLASA